MSSCRCPSTKFCSSKPAGGRPRPGLSGFLGNRARVFRIPRICRGLNLQFNDPVVYFVEGKVKRGCVPPPPQHAVRGINRSGFNRRRAEAKNSNWKKAT